MHNRNRVASQASVCMRSGSHLHNYIHQHFLSSHLHEKHASGLENSVRSSRPSVNRLALAVFSAFGLLVVTPGIAVPIFAADWDGSQESVLKIDDPQLGDVHTIFKEATSGDRFDLDSGQHNWLWTTQNTEKPTLKITVNGIVTGTQSAGGGNFSDPWNNTNALWLTASLKTILTGSSYGNDNSALFQALANAVTAGDNFSSTTNNSSVILNFESGSGLLAKVYGARNDLGGGLSVDSYDSKAGEANYNTVEVNMASDSKFYAKLVFGGRSAQLDGITVPVHAGFDTNYNTVTINNGIGDKSAEDLDCGDTLITDLGVVVSKGIFGAEGYRTNNNKVALTDAVIVSGMPTARKLGLVGGRGLYYYRINAASNDFVNGTEIYSDGSGKKVSAIANNNVVSIKNSYIGYYISKNDNDWNTNWANSTYPEADADHSSVGFTVYGGWSTGIASNNIVAVEDSVINGNVIGGFEFRDQLQVNKDSLRDLSTNIVSLKDTVLKKGSSIYGSATAVGTSSSKGENFLQEDSTKLVNRRRGVAYIAGKVAADSAYVRYISFGQYLELDKLNNEVSYTVSQGYYPTEGQDVELETSLNSSLESGSLESVTKHLTGKEERSIHLGQQVAQSYLINRNGYHSSLAPSSTDNGISQSDVTKGQHNFWVGAYANLSDSVNGDGTSFDTKVKLFNDEENVNHGYAGGELSLLTHDDGMWYDYTSREQDGSLGAENSNHRPALMHQFRYHYQGLVLYLGVNDGESGEPVVQISFDEIANFRKEQNQNTNAFGNTFIGIIKDGTVYQKGSNEEGNKTVDASLMTFDVPGFEINQGGDHVADATYAFYKYMHFDGHDGEFEDENAAGEKISVSGKVSDPGEAGVGIKYWLKSVNILPGKLLVLNGKLENSELYVEDFQSGDTSKPKQELFTLSAELTGAGGVAIAKNSTVIIGSPDTIYNIDVGKTNTEPSVSGNGQALYEVVSKAPQPNSYTGNTVVDEGAMLVLGIDGALGTQGKSDTEDRYTSILHIGSFEAGSNPPQQVYICRGISKQ